MNTTASFFNFYFTFSTHGIVGISKFWALLCPVWACVVYISDCLKSKVEHFRTPLGERTCFHRASIIDSLKLVQNIIKKGSNYESKAKYEETPVDRTCKNVNRYLKMKKFPKACSFFIYGTSSRNFFKKKMDFCIALELLH